MSTSIAAASAKGEYCSGCCVSQERGCVVLGYAMTVVILSQERKNTSVVPMVPRVSFQLLISCLSTLGLANSADNVNTETIGVMDRMRSNIDRK